MSRPVEVPTEMATDDPRRRAFEAYLDKALDRASDTLKPLFETAYSALSDEEIESLHEIMFRLGGARQILIHRDYMRIPTEPATCTDLKAATYSDPMPAGVPI